MKAYALAPLVLLLACSKRPAPPPPAPSASAAAAAATSPRPAADAAPPPCDLAVETRTADVVVVRGWREAARRAAGFEEDPPKTEGDAKGVLCRMDACAEAPPWQVKAMVVPHPFPTNLIAPVGKGGELAVLRVGTTGADPCDGRKDPVSRIVSEPSMAGDVIVFDEEVTPLRGDGDGSCEVAGTPVHTWHVVDPKTKKELVLRGTDLAVEVRGRNVSVKSPGCRETRSF